MNKQPRNNAVAFGVKQMQIGASITKPNLNDYNHFLNEVLSIYGYDFKQYKKNMLHRRLHHLKGLLKVDSLYDLVPLLHHDNNVFKQLLSVLSISVTDFFREPLLYIEIKKQIIPVLETYPFINIWCAGCSTGEEAYSLAILLAEHDLLDRCFIYATDMNEASLAHARSGEYSIEKMQTAIDNYATVNSRTQLNKYFDQSTNTFNVKPYLKERIIFSNHNLLDDGVFAEIHFITCRNVMMYFNKTLKNRCLTLFSESLTKHGFLSLGSKESTIDIDSNNIFELVDKKSNLYRKNTA